MPFRAALLAACLLPSILAHAGKLEKAFKALEVHDYFKARSLFQKEVKKHPAAAWYGLSVISGRPDNPFFDLDSAYLFILKADLAFTGTPDKERMTIGAVGVSYTSIQAQRQHVYDLAWDKARGQNTVAAYQRYVEQYPAGTRAEEARTIMHHLAFTETREANTAVAYKKFINGFPDAREVYEARTRLQGAIYEEATVNKDIPAFLAFIQAHPENPNVRKAEDEIFKLSTPRRTIPEYQAFIQNYPDNHHVPDAWRSIYESYSRDLSVGSITRFIAEYPDYPFMDELVDDYRTASLEMLPFRRQGKWGFIDHEGTERVKAEYDWVDDFKAGQALVGRDDRVGSINRSGRVVIPIEFDEVNEAMESTSVVERAGRVGAVDRSGEFVVPMNFSDLGDFSEGLAYAEDHGSYGYVNARGEGTISFGFTSAGNFHNGLAVVEREGRFGAIDRQGQFVVPPEYDWVEGFEQGRSRVRKGDHMGLLSSFGELLLQPVHDHIGTFNNGLSLVVTDSKCGYVDTTGHFAIPQEYEANTDVAAWGDFHAGLAEVQLQGKHGVVDIKNQRVLPFNYVDIGGTNGPLFPVKKKTKWGFVDRAGNTVGDAKYDLAWDYVGGVARVKIGDAFGAIDSTGKEVMLVQYPRMRDAQFGYIVAGEEGKLGLWSISGDPVSPAIYSDITLVNTRIAKVEQGDLFGYLDIEEARFLWKEDGFDR
ncbi:MAG: WG repeat-containing protein [Flavobacteriales bacterium]|nr:WG repeat-containing protein [Flavobacteriales bacterium]